MDNNTYNLQRYNRKKLWYRVGLGAQQLVNYPILNVIWILYVAGVWLLMFLKQKIILGIETITIFEPIFKGCMNFVVIYFSIICIIVILWEIGQITARRDEANMEIVFGNERIVKKQNPILISKKIMKRKGVVIREFYTVIPMARWQDKKDDICDIFNIHLVEDIKYGKSNGNRIVIKSAKDRLQKDRGLIYDDTF